MTRAMEGSGGALDAEALCTLLDAQDPVHGFPGLPAPPTPGIWWEKPAEACSYVAVARDVPPDVLRALSKDERTWLRHAVASHPSLPRDAILRLAQDRDPDVAVAISERTDHDGETARLLCTSRFPLVRGNLAGWSECPPDLLAKLLKDRDEINPAGVRVCEKAAGNPSLDEETAVRIARTGDVWIAVHLARRNVSLTPALEVALLGRSEVNIQRAMASSETLSARCGDVLTRSPEESVREHLAQYGGPLSREAEIALAFDPAAPVRWRLAARSERSADVLAVLLQDEDIWARTAAEMNPSAPVQGRIAAILAMEPDDRFVSGIDNLVRHRREGGASAVEAFAEIDAVATLRGLSVPAVAQEMRDEALAECSRHEVLEYPFLVEDKIEAFRSEEQAMVERIAQGRVDNNEGRLSDLELAVLDPEFRREFRPLWVADVQQDMQARAAAGWTPAEDLARWCALAPCAVAATAKPSLALVVPSASVEPGPIHAVDRAERGLGLAPAHEADRDKGRGR